jgi:hypothetical protein
MRFAVVDVRTPSDDLWRELSLDPPPLKPPRI